MPLPGGVTLPLPVSPIVNWIPAAVLFAISALLEMLRASFGGERSDAYYVVAVFAMAAYLIRTTVWAVMHMRLIAALPTTFRPTACVAATEAAVVPYYNLYWAFRTAFTAWTDLANGVERWCQAANVPANRDTLQLFGNAMSAIFACDIFLHFPLLDFIASSIVGKPWVAIPLGLLGIIGFVCYYSTVVGLMSRAATVMPAHSIPSGISMPQR